MNRKLISLTMAMLLLCAMALNACGKKETPETTQAATEPAATTQAALESERQHLVQSQRRHHPPDRCPQPASGRGERRLRHPPGGRDGGDHCLYLGGRQLCGGR